MKLTALTFASIMAIATSHVAVAQDGLPPASSEATSPVPASIEPAPTTVPETTATTETAQPVAVAPTANTAGLMPTVPADGCELHIWPAERMQSITTGWLGGGLLDAMIHSGTDANNKTLLASALDSPSQLDALQSLDLRSLLSITPGTTIIRHEAPLERKTMNKVKTRRSDSTAQCYSELIVGDVFYQKAALYGRSLRTLFMFRNFGNDQKIDKEYKAWGGNGLKLFPPKEGEDAIAALDELVSVYKKNFDEYAHNARTALAAAKTAR
ncbi:MAG: hypothetical protein R3D83_07490 [Caenibius sp.]